jgi:hypothetical protein
VEIERVYDHRQPVELHIDVRAGRQRLDVGAPARENVAALVRPNPERAAEMVQHDLHLRAFARHLDQTLDLRVVDPRLEGQIMARQAPQAVAEARIVISPGGGT